MPEDDIECKSFTVTSIDSLFVCEKKHYLQIYLDNCAYKIVNKQMENHLDENVFQRLDVINAVLLLNWYKRRNWSY